MRDDFAVLIITHGRPDAQYTLESLKRGGYSGKAYLVVDDEDETKERYIELYGADTVKIFHKVPWFDLGDNFYDLKNASVYARNECFKVAGALGLTQFLMLDDDYTDFVYRYIEGGSLKAKRVYDLDQVFEAYCEFLKVGAITCLAFGVSGDYIGGVTKKVLGGMTRKARNSFFCDLSKPFQFLGRYEDITTPAYYNSVGRIFATVLGVCLLTVDREKQTGGMADLKKEDDHYCEYFYSVIWCPSGIKIRREKSGAFIVDQHTDALYPKIISESWRK